MKWLNDFLVKIGWKKSKEDSIDDSPDKCEDHGMGPSFVWEKIMPTKEYVIVETIIGEGEENSRFVDKCKQLMSDGWNPQGGVCVFQKSIYHVYCQAFVK